MTSTETLSPDSHSGQLVHEAVRHHRRLSKQGLMEWAFAVWFRGFVYNQIWEDPRVDLEALQLDSESRVLAISSGGCNVLNYLVAKPKQIVAVDLNRCHMSLTRLKLAAIKHLPDFESFYHFFGCADGRQNVENYRHYISEHLDEDTRWFWEGGSWLRRGLRRRRINYFAKGFYDRSKLGQFLRVVHGLGRIVRKNPNLLLQAKSLQEQQEIFDKHFAPLFDFKLVRLSSKMPLAVYSLGIPPNQFKAMKEQSQNRVAALYRERVRRLACDFPIEDNYFAWQAFSRGYDRVNRKALPDYLKPENYDVLRANVHRVHTHLTSTTAYLKQQPDQSMNRFVFLDSQDWMPPQVIAEQWRQVARVGQPGSRVIFRTAAADSPIETALPAELKRRFQYLREQSLELHRKDRSAIYGGFHLYLMP